MIGAKPAPPSASRDPYWWIVPIAVILMFGAAGFGFWKMIEDLEHSKAEHAEYWRGAVAVRVCRDGTHIWKTRDGELRGAWGNTYDKTRDPKELCE